MGVCKERLLKGQDVEIPKIGIFTSKDLMMILLAKLEYFPTIEIQSYLDQPFKDHASYSDLHVVSDVEVASA